MLTARLNGPTELNLWHGVADQALARNVNLICFSGGIPRARQEYEEQKNILFKIAGEKNVDGLLVWANILSHTLNQRSLETFCQRYLPLPMISMGMVLPFIPSIRIDMREGMKKMLIHLIEHHDRRKIAFIRGPEVSQDAEERYQSYCEMLNQYGLGYDMSLVMPGNFGRDSGRAAVEQLLERRRINFDALVIANDNMAIGVLEALKARGVLVPDDVIVTGFDDIEEAQAITPTLTTVHTPWYTLGTRCVDLLLSRMAGEPLPEQIYLQTELVLRQSCGCVPAASERRDARIEAITGIRVRHDWIDRFATSLVSDVRSDEDQPQRFIACLAEALSSSPSGTETIEWQQTLDAIKVRLKDHPWKEKENNKTYELLETGYSMVGENAHQKQLAQRLEEEDRIGRLNRIVQTMATTYDIETLMKLLAQDLPGLDIQSCFLSLYDEKGECPSWSRLILAFDRKERYPLDQGGIRFPTRELIPEGFFPQNRTFAYDVEALYFKDEQIGFVLFEIGPRDGEVYTALRGHLSSALKSAGLVQAALEAEAKAVKADQLKTHLLANVSHELRAPINIILGLSQMGLSIPNPYGIELPEQFAQDLKHIYESGEHLVRLINDLLDISRAEIGELDLYFEPVQPLSLLKETYEGFVRSSNNNKKELEFCLDLPERIPVIQADPVRLRQILMNLLSNAFNFTEHGKIILGAEVQLPHLHLWVEDTGSGISLELQERIFEPFVKADLPALRRSGIGLGLSITRRLVALHGGSITLDSSSGRGSTFHVYLPLPGIRSVTAQPIQSESRNPLLLCISGNKHPIPYVADLCQKNGFTLIRISSADELDAALQQGRPIALTWDLDNARPGDWSIVQNLRSYAQFAQLPLLLFQEKIMGVPDTSRQVTNVMLKPVGKHTLQHLLDFMPQGKQHGEIWIIDDDFHVLKYYQEVLSISLSNYTVRAIQSGREAMQMLGECSPELIILDLMMPDIDGFQVLEYLRSNPETALIPVVILTGKMLTYEDVQRLNFPKVSLQTKGILSGNEAASEIQRILGEMSAVPQASRTLVRQAYAYIQQNYTRSFSLKELADTLGVSKGYLSRIFKLESGLALWEYLNRFRIQKAKEILVLSDESITQIAGDVGFDDVGYFSRVFRQVTGCSPRTYKQRILVSHNS